MMNDAISMSTIEGKTSGKESGKVPVMLREVDGPLRALSRYFIQTLKVENVWFFTIDFATCVVSVFSVVDEKWQSREFSQMGRLSERLFRIERCPVVEYENGPFSGQEPEFLLDHPGGIESVMSCLATLERLGEVGFVMVNKPGGFRDDDATALTELMEGFQLALAGASVDGPTPPPTSVLPVGPASWVAPLAPTEQHHLKALGRLAGGMAHDMNNILAVVTGLVSVLEAGLEGDDPRREDVAHVLTACQQGRDLTRHLLGVAGKGLLHRGTTDANDVVREVRTRLRQTLPSGIRVRTQLEDELAALWVDQSRVTEALYQLALNAVEAMGTGGTVTLSTDNVELSEQEAGALFPDGTGAAGAYVRFQVEDNGRGMEIDVLTQAFEPYFTTKPFGGGSGLGLSMVYGTAAAHQGTVTLRSHPGEGTVASLYVPVAQRSSGFMTRGPQMQRQPAGPACEGYQGTVLLVDDEDLVRTSGQRVLEAMGFDVLLADNGQTALDLYRERSDEITLVIMDLMMPVMDGGDALVALKELKPDLPVWIASGVLGGGHAEILLTHGATGLVEKPYTLQGLAEQLAKVLK
jgi:signal transduction histidine kinase